MRNLIELINAFYDLDIPKSLDPSSSFLFITLLRKFNSTKNRSNGEYFPECLPIYNLELQNLTGMEKRSFHNARQRLIDYRIIPSDDSTWLVKYKSYSDKKAGLYCINYDLLENMDFNRYIEGIQNEKMVTKISNIEAEDGKNGNENFQHSAEKFTKMEKMVTKNVNLDQKSDIKLEKMVTENAQLDQKSDIKLEKNAPLSSKQNKTKQNKTKQNSSSSSSNTVSSIQSGNEPNKIFEEEEKEDVFSDQEKESFQKAKEAIEKQYQNFFLHNYSRGMPEFMRSMLISIGQHEDNEINSAVLKAVKGTKNLAYLIENIYNNINNGNNKPREPDHYDSPEFLQKRAENERKINEAVKQMVNAKEDLKIKYGVK